MATIKCEGDCTRCEYLKNREVDPRECASIYAFLGVQKLHNNMMQMHREIISAINEIKKTENKPIPGIEFETSQPMEEQPVEIKVSETQELEITQQTETINP